MNRYRYTIPSLDQCIVKMDFEIFNLSRLQIFAVFESFHSTRPQKNHILAAAYLNSSYSSTTDVFLDAQASLAEILVTDSY